MNKSSFRIIFMGTPDFAVASLKALVENQYNVVAVVTMPDKPMGRHGSVLQPSAVKQYAASVGLPVLQPEKLKDEAFLEELRSYQADLQIVVAFRMLPEVVWNMPPHGTFNLHASLLPQYRGAAPINWAIINGEKETGITTFFLQQEIDTGAIIHQERLPIGPEDNAEVVHDSLMAMGADLVLRTVDDILSDNVHPISQDEYLAADAASSDSAPLKPAPKLFRENTRIDWQQSAVAIHDFIRGLSPYPAAWTTFVSPDGTETTLKLFESRVVASPDAASEDVALSPGEIDTDGKTYIKIGTREGVLSILSLQLAGKKRMPAPDFLRGHAQLNLCKVY